MLSVRLTDSPIPVCQMPIIATFIPKESLDGMQVESVPRQEASGEMNAVDSDGFN